MDISIRTFTEDDIEFAVSQTTREGWETTAELFQAALALDPNGSFIGEAKKERVAMMTTTRYTQTGWIGNLIVPPEHQRQGIGERMMKHAMQYLLGRGIQTIRLEADPPGINIYRRLGFVDEFESLRFLREPGPAAPGGAAERMRPDDLPAIAAFDLERFGDRRDKLLGLLLARAKTAHWVRHSDEVGGYAFTVASRAGIRISPCVARDARTAEQLLQSVLSEVGDTTVILGVPSVNEDAAPLFESYGFKRTPSSFRMIYGPKVAPGRPECVFAIANGAMG